MSSNNKQKEPIREETSRIVNLLKELGFETVEALDILELEDIRGRGLNEAICAYSQLKEAYKQAGLEVHDRQSERTAKVPTRPINTHYPPKDTLRRDLVDYIGTRRELGDLSREPSFQA